MDAPDTPEVLAERLVEFDERLRLRLIDVPTAEEARALKIEHFAEEIRAWLDGR
jgi:hypothetical protein